MRYLILSDLHANLEALQAVEAAADGAYDQIVCCGDLVGYGADPDAVVDWSRQHVNHMVRGNHDKACSGMTEPEDFSELAQVSTFWTRKHLRSDTRQYLRSLPQGPREVAGQFAILHGSPRHEDEYLPAAWAAVGAFELLRHRVSFFGHTHLQGGFVRTRSRVEEIPLRPISASSSSGTKARGVLEIQPDETYLINPGSVGQPRDRDNRAAFAIYDTDGIIEYGRVTYDLDTAMRKILDGGLPELLAYRLTVGR